MLQDSVGFNLETTEATEGVEGYSVSEQFERLLNHVCCSNRPLRAVMLLLSSHCDPIVAAVRQHDHKPFTGCLMHTVCINCII